MNRDRHTKGDSGMNSAKVALKAIEQGQPEGRHEGQCTVQEHSPSKNGTDQRRVPRQHVEG